MANDSLRSLNGDCLHTYREVPGALCLLPGPGHITLLGQTGGQLPLACQPPLQPMIKDHSATKPRPPTSFPAVVDKCVSMAH